MEIIEQMREALIRGCYDMAEDAIQECLSSLDIAMGILEKFLNEGELANDPRYTALCALYEPIKDGIKILNNESK